MEMGNVITESGSEWPVVCDRYCLWPAAPFFVRNTLWYCWHQLASFISVGDAFEVSQSCDTASMSRLAAVSWDHLYSSAVQKNTLTSLKVWVISFIPCKDVLLVSEARIQDFICDAVFSAGIALHFLCSAIIIFSEIQVEKKPCFFFFFILNNTLAQHQNSGSYSCE